MADREELSNRYLQMSRKFIRQAQEELDDNDDLVQVSEKAWGAAAQSLKSIAARRGWNHQNHGLLRDLATHLYLEFGRPDISLLFGTLENAHVNYYEHRFDREEVQFQLDRCVELLEQLNEIREMPPLPFVPATPDQERRLSRLTRYRPETAADAALDISALPPV